MLLLMEIYIIAIVEIRTMWFAKFRKMHQSGRVDEWILRLSTRVTTRQKIQQFRFAKHYESRVYRNISRNNNIQPRLPKLLLEIIVTK